MDICHSHIHGGQQASVNQYMSVETLLYSTTEKQDVTDYGFEVGVKPGHEKTINYKKFLGLWKNKEGKYILGEEFDPNGKKVSYNLPDEENAKYYPPDKIAQEQGQNIDELINLLGLHADTQMHEELMKYYWNIYEGKEIYDVDLDAILDLFDTNITQINGSTSSSSLLKDYIRSWEGARYNSDRTKYVVVDDGAGNRVVGYGIDIVNGGYESTFRNAGYSTELGAEIDIDFVDGLEDLEIADCLSRIKALTSGLNLKEYQIHALVSRAYNCRSRWSSNYQKRKSITKFCRFI